LLALDCGLRKTAEWFSFCRASENNLGDRVRLERGGVERMTLNLELAVKKATFLGQQNNPVAKFQANTNENHLGTWRGGRTPGCASLATSQIEIIAPHSANKISLQRDLKDLLTNR